MAKVIQDVGERPLVLHSDVREPLDGMSFLQRALVLVGFDEAELFDNDGDEIYLDRNGNIRRLTGVLRSRDRWRGFLKGLARGQLDPLADHSIHHYVEHIWSAAQAEARSVDRGQGEVREDEIVVRHTESEPTS